MRDVVVIPTYNERELIAGLLRKVFNTTPNVFVWVVDDTSPDGTAEEVRDLQKTFKNLSLHVRPKKTGLGSAYLEVFSLLLADPTVRTITTMDADWSHNPVYIPDLLQESWRHDVVVGSRYVSGGGVPRWEAWRRLLSWGGNAYARLVTGVPVCDLTAGFVCFRREVLERMDFSKIHSAGYAYTIESKCLAYRSGARIKEIPIVFEERRGGESKISKHVIREGVAAPWRIRFSRLS